MKKVALHNLGCKVNSYETEAMQQILENSGYEIVPFKEGADIYIINTCTVTNIADRKSRQMLHKAKKMNQDAIVIATGCYAQASKDDIEKDECIDIVIGNNKKGNIVDAIREYENSHNLVEDVIDINHTDVFEELSIDKVSEHTRAYIKIQDGCNQFCSYCIIPFARGRVRSRDKDSVIKEVRELVKSGYKEIVLTGIHLSSYGVDFGEDKKTSLIDIMTELNDIEGLCRIRLGSLEPRIITDEFVKRASSLEKVCPHFHLSLQSGCDETLARMNRKYTSKEYKESCDLLRKYYDNPAITTDVIVGFPGETEEEFNITKQFVEDIRFFEMHIFRYSVRKGTRAEKMDNQVNENIKIERGNILAGVEAKLSKSYRDTFIGTTTEILVEEEIELEGQRYQIGHTREYVKMAIPYDYDRSNTIVKARVLRKVTNEILLCEILD